MHIKHIYTIYISCIILTVILISDIDVTEKIRRIVFEGEVDENLVSSFVGLYFLFEIFILCWLVGMCRWFGLVFSTYYYGFGLINHS